MRSSTLEREWEFHPFSVHSTVTRHSNSDKTRLFSEGRATACCLDADVAVMHEARGTPTRYTHRRPTMAATPCVECATERVDRPRTCLTRCRAEPQRTTWCAASASLHTTCACTRFGVRRRAHLTLAKVSSDALHIARKTIPCQTVFRLCCLSVCMCVRT